MGVQYGLASFPKSFTKAGIENCKHVSHFFRPPTKLGPCAGLNEIECTVNAHFEGKKKAGKPPVDISFANFKLEDNTFSGSFTSTYI